MEGDQVVPRAAAAPARHHGAMTGRVLTVVGGYALVGGAWIVVSSTLAAGDAGVAGVEIAKGLAFVAVTAAVLALLLTRHERQVEETAGRFRGLIERTGEVTYRFTVGERPRITHISDNIVDLIGVTAEEHLANPDIVSLTVHPEDRAVAAAMVSGDLPPPLVHVRLVATDGRIVHTEHAHGPVRDRRGRLVAVETRMRDVTRERRDAAALALGAELDRWLLSGRPPLEVLERTCLRLLDGFDVDAAWIGLRQPDGRVELAASAGGGTYFDGVEARWDDDPLGDGPTGRAIRDERPVLVRPDDDGFAPWRTRAARAGFSSVLALPIRDRSGVIAVLTVYARFGQPFEEAAVRRFEAVARRLGAVLDRIDDVPDLPHRAAYPTALARVAGAHDGRADLCVVVVGRLTGLRRSAGFEVGERALSVVASRIAAIVPAASVVRTGDDEVCVVAHPAGDVAQLGVALAASLRDAVQVGGDDLVLPVGVGCLTVEPGDDAERALRRATAAAARAYEEQPFSCVVAGGELETAERDRTTLQELRRAIAGGGIEVWWQPQIDAATGLVVAAEALVRWRRADGSISTPADFIELAEDDGCIVDIGRIVLREAVRRGRSWRTRGLDRICVNASVRELSEPGYVDRLRGLLVEAGLPPAALEIELVETTLLGRRVAEVLDDVQRLGVRVAVDDYGTGWSSLSYLAQFRFDTLKIDRAFVRDLTVDDRALALVDSTVALGSALGITVVAEGVEEVRHAEHLREVGCDLLQGYAISPPVPADELPGFLDGWRFDSARSSAAVPTAADRPTP